MAGSAVTMKWPVLRTMKRDVRDAWEGIAAGHFINSNLRKAENGGEEL